MKMTSSSGGEEGHLVHDDRERTKKRKDSREAETDLIHDGCACNRGQPLLRMQGGPMRCTHSASTKDFILKRRDRRSRSPSGGFGGVGIDGRGVKGYL